VTDAGERRVRHNLQAPGPTREVWYELHPPLLQPDPDLRQAGIVGDRQRALAAGDVEAAVAALGRDRRRGSVPVRCRTPDTSVS
jgi:hypothetical protein